jgi:hypothetical protein
LIEGFRLFILIPRWSKSDKEHERNHIKYDCFPPQKFSASGGHFEAK